MIILTNGLSDRADEGGLKVASNLVKRMKTADPQTMVISYGAETELADLHLQLNKVFLNRKLRALARTTKQSILYIPLSSNTLGSILRTWTLSRLAPERVKVLFVLQHPMSALAKKLLKASGAEVVVLSKQAYTAYKEQIGVKTIYLKTGVDTEQFQPATSAQKAKLRETYGVPSEKTVVLHVGHLKRGRNLEQLLKLGPEYHIILALSSVTADEQDESLRKDLLARDNITVIDTYLPNIEELYQIADVYFFPVQEKENCIDAPLSVLEATACGIPVVTTPYGELKELINKEGFYPIESFESAALESLLQKAATEGKTPRQSVLEYDWNTAVKKLLMRTYRNPKNGGTNYV